MTDIASLAHQISTTSDAELLVLYDTLRRQVGDLDARAMWAAACDEVDRWGMAEDDQP